MLPPKRRPSEFPRFIESILFVMLSGLACASASAIGGKVTLARKYRAAQAMVYVTNVNTKSQLDSNPPQLKSFFPPMPTNFRVAQQSTVTVDQVHPDGSADVRQRFDKFEIKTDASDLPDSLRQSMDGIQQEISQKFSGQSLTAHFSKDGRLTDVDGADSLFPDAEGPVREPLIQMMRLSLEQVGGQSLYPDHRVKRGESWVRSLAAEPSSNYPFQVSGQNTLQFIGKTRYHGVKAAIVDYHFENTLTPAPAGLAKKGSLPQLQAMGMKLAIKIEGKGQGRVLVALDDGRVLQSHSSMHQTLSAVMKGSEGLILPTAQSPQLQIQSDIGVEVEGRNP